MPQESIILLTPGEAAAVAEVPVKAVYKVMAERLPKSSLVRRSGRILLTPTAVACVRLDYELPKDVPVRVRRFVFERLQAGESGRVEYGTTLFAYVVDPRPAVAQIRKRMRSYGKALKMITEDPEIQGGAATLKGTRILVHQIASLLAQGVPEAELLEDYPNLTPAMIEAAQIFAQAHPRRGRPRKPAWRDSRSTAVARRVRSQSA